MPNSEELIRIREAAIENYKKNYRIEQLLFDNAKEYYDRIITTELNYQANKYLTDEEISVVNCGRFITTNNKELANLFLAKFTTEELKCFTYEYIDNISTKNDPIIYVKGKESRKYYEYFTRISYIKKLAKEEKYNFQAEIIDTPCGYSDSNIFIEFTISTKVPKLVFSDQKVLTRKK